MVRCRSNHWAPNRKAQEAGLPRATSPVGELRRANMGRVHTFRQRDDANRREVHHSEESYEAALASGGVREGKED